MFCLRLIPSLSEGCHFIDSLPHEKMMDIARKYVQKEKEVTLLKSTLLESNMSEDDKETIVRILDEGGVRTSLSI